MSITASFISRSLAILWSSVLASSIRSWSAQSTTKIRPVEIVHYYIYAQSTTKIRPVEIVYYLINNICIIYYVYQSCENSSLLYICTIYYEDKTCEIVHYYIYAQSTMKIRPVKIVHYYIYAQSTTKIRPVILNIVYYLIIV